MNARRLKEPLYKNGYRRGKPTHGVMYDANTYINPLPNVGDTIVIEEKICINGRTTYQLATARLDPWYRPKLYKVHGFTHGKEDVFNPFNKMECTYTTLSGVELKQHINTLQIVTGSMRAVTASPAKLKLWRYL